MNPPREDEARPDAATGADYLARVRALAPLIAASLEEMEKIRRLPPPLVAAMVEADLFRMLLPRPFGGAELDPVSFAQVIEALARLDGSTAWVLGQTAVTAMTAARLAPEAAWEIWGDRNAILAWGPTTDAKAIVVEGGYRVTGNWAFASGCQHATWLGGEATVCEADGKPSKRAGGKPEVRRVLFPKARVAMRDVWQVIGLKGTGSDGYGVSDLFVPERFTVLRNEDPSQRRYFGRLYDFSTQAMFPAGFGSLALGLARSMLESFLALTQEKTPRGYKNRLREDAVTQSDIGYNEAKLRAARAHLMGAVAEAWAGALSRNAVSIEERMAIRLAGTYAIRQARDVAEWVYEAAGTTSIFLANPFERRFRDIHTVAQQLQGRKSHYQTVGQYLLGMEVESGWV